MSDPTLFVQLCALNECDSIGSVIQRIPRQISGIASLTILVVDDGSNDDTAQVASGRLVRTSSFGMRVTKA